jgi:hypothetical protein
MKTPLPKLLSKVAWLVIPALAAQTAAALTTNLIPVADTALRSDAAGNNYGTLTPLPVGVGRFGSPRNNVLLKFDVSGLPGEAVINSATLALVVKQGQTPTADFSLHRLLKDWGEGAQLGFPAAANEATWNARFHPSTLWSTPGGAAGTDYAAAASATAPLTLPSPGGTTTNTFTSAQMAADVAMWLSSSGTNFGWILLATGAAEGSGKQIASREDTTHRPVLTVNYSVGGSSPGSPPLLFGTALDGNQFRFSFNAESNRTYTVEARNSLTAGTWTELTNIPAQPTDATVTITNTVGSTDRYFRVRTP